MNYVLNITKNNLICIYRFSDGGQTSPGGQTQAKGRPEYFNKQKIFLNFIKEFGTDNVIVVADNVTDASIEFLSKYISSDKIIQTNFKSGALSFLYSVEYAIDNSNKLFNNNNNNNNNNSETYVYLVEDDYIHRPGAKKILLEGLQISDYLTLYDHPDKYKHPHQGGNPYVVDGGERSIVYLTESAHWKITNSTTMTFATKLSILREDYLIYKKYCNTGYPYDFQMFLELGKTRKLISSIPGYSTHCENNMLSPIYDWEKCL